MERVVRLDKINIGDVIEVMRARREKDGDKTKLILLGTDLGYVVEMNLEKVTLSNRKPYRGEKNIFSRVEKEEEAIFSGEYEDESTTYTWSVSYSEIDSYERIGNVLDNPAVIYGTT